MTGRRRGVVAAATRRLRPLIRRLRPRQQRASAESTTSRRPLANEFRGFAATRGATRAIRALMLLLVADSAYARSAREYAVRRKRLRLRSVIIASPRCRRGVAAALHPGFQRCRGPWRAAFIIASSLAMPKASSTGAARATASGDIFGNGFLPDDCRPRAVKAVVATTIVRRGNMLVFACAKALFVVPPRLRGRAATMRRTRSARGADVMFGARNGSL